MITRDSHLWWVGIGTAVVTYLLSVGRPPTEWTYIDWLQCAAVLLAALSGKMATSPLKGEPK